MTPWGRRPTLSFPDVGSIEGPLLEVIDLHTSFRTGRGLVRAVHFGVSFTLGPGPYPGGGGRVGVGQDGAQPLHHGPAARLERGALGDGPLRRPRPHHHVPRPVARGVGDAGRHGVPGPHDGAQPRRARRAPDHRVTAPAGRARPQGRLRDGGGAAQLGGHPRARAAAAQLPPRAVGGDAPEGDDRHRPGVRPQAPPRRRAHHRPRRHRAGPDPRPPRRPAGRAPHGDDPRHPRPRRGGQPHRRDRGDVRGPGRRAGPDGRALRPHPHALHRGAAALDPAPGRALATPGCAPSRAGPPTWPPRCRVVGSRRVVPMSRTTAAKRSRLCAPPARATSSGAGTRWARPRATPALAYNVAANVPACAGLHRHPGARGKGR